MNLFCRFLLCLLTAILNVSFRSNHLLRWKVNRLVASRLKSTSEPSDTPFVNERVEDFEQTRDLDLILSERAKRFYVNNGQEQQKEKCVLLSVDSKYPNTKSVSSEDDYFSFEESLNELSELVGTAGLQVVGTCFQKLNAPNSNSYINIGKAFDLMVIVNSTGAQTIVVDVSNKINKLICICRQ